MALKGLGAWDTVSPRVVWINDALTAKLGPGWHASMIDAWWFKVICLLIAGWLLFRIGSLSQQAEQRAGKEIAAISASLAEREAALLMRAMEIPSRMAQYWAKEQQHRMAVNQIESLARCADSFKGMMEQMKGGGPQMRWVGQPDSLDNQAGAWSAELASAYLYLTGVKTDTGQLQRESPNVQIDVSSTQRPRSGIFEPELNQHYFDVHAANYVIMQGQLAAIKNVEQGILQNLNVARLEIERLSGIR